MKAKSTHFNDLLDVIAVQRTLNSGGIPVSTIDSVMPRKDAVPVAEGEALSGNVYSGVAEVCLTLAASPHFQASMLIDTFVSGALAAFGQEPKLSSEQRVVQRIAPHMIVWWQVNRQDGRSQANMLDLAAMAREQCFSFIDGISAQVRRAFAALEGAEGQPVIYGSWGFCDPENRIRFGFGRGAPTLPHGHLHLAKVDLQHEVIYLKDVPPPMALKHYQPWNRLLNNLCGHEIARMLEAVAMRNAWESVEHVSFYDGVVEHSSSYASSQQGYELVYKVPQLFEIVFDHVICIAREIEQYYQAMHTLFAEYHLNCQSESAQERVVERMQSVSQALGFSSRGAQELANFVVRIVPTSSQLGEWIACLLNDEGELEGNSALESMKQELTRRTSLMTRDGKDRHSVTDALVRDTYRSARECEIIHAWPGTSSATYIFDDIEVDKQQVLIRKVSLHPAIVSATGAPEKILGAAVIRDIAGIARS